MRQINDALDSINNCSHALTENKQKRSDEILFLNLGNKICVHNKPLIINL
jgi:hypothetical protein